MQPIIFGIEGTILSDREVALFRQSDPAGYILFRRNVVDVTQVRALTDSLRELSGRPDVPILIDQEGGRVARMRPPVWPDFPKAELFDRLYDIAPISAIEASRANARAIALMLREAGVNVNCLPLLDVRQPDAHDIIGDRALGSEPLRIAAMGRAVLDGMASAGVVGIVKHIPGHGRSYADSHHDLPVVDADADALETDLAPFIALADAAMAMTAHIVYPAWDADRCATVSPIVIGDIIRGRIGFDGLLMSDDLGMQALTGSFGDRAINTIRAGCDVALHCSGNFDEMQAIVDALDEIGDLARLRLDRAMASVTGPVLTDGETFAEMVARRDALLALNGDDDTQLAADPTDYGHGRATAAA
jgi:beta-N-acetylhexosaminidase